MKISKFCRCIIAWSSMAIVAAYEKAYKRTKCEELVMYLFNYLYLDYVKGRHFDLDFLYSTFKPRR